MCLRVSLSLCVSVMSHLTSGASVHLESIVTYSVGNKGHNIVGLPLKPLRYRDPALPPLMYSQPSSCRKHACTLIVFTTPRVCTLVHLFSNEIFDIRIHSRAPHKVYPFH